MPEARIIPIDGDRPKRRPARSASDAVAAGAARASGERSRRRTATPLLDADAKPPADKPSRAGTAGTPGTATSGARSRGAARSPKAAPRAAPRAGKQAPKAEMFDDLSAVSAEMDAGVGTGNRVEEEWERKTAAVLAFLRRRLTGEVEIDEFGFDPELTDKVLLAMMRPLYERYFRVETRGLENVPAEGGALVVANHSGTIPLDSVMTQLALLDHHSGRRHLRMLGADLVFQTPVIGELARKTGTTLACNADAERLLRKGELVGVWPEGFKGIGKPFSERYKLQRFGRGGFVSAALRTQVPIVPCSIVGAEEIYPILGNMKTLARLLGLPYVPITPTFPWLGPLGAIPLPSKWIIEFGEPIRTDGLGPEAADDPMLVFNITDQVRETIQHTLYRLLMRRRSVFF
jgi:1-acyl-sn-glycerol-3-phosphate acyltransferase